MGASQSHAALAPQPPPAGTTRGVESVPMALFAANSAPRRRSKSRAHSLPPFLNPPVPAPPRGPHRHAPLHPQDPLAQTCPHPGPSHDGPNRGRLSLRPADGGALETRTIPLTPLRSERSDQLTCNSGTCTATPRSGDEPRPGPARIPSSSTLHGSDTTSTSACSSPWAARRHRVSLDGTTPALSVVCRHSRRQSSSQGPPNPLGPASLPRTQQQPPHAAHSATIASADFTSTVRGQWSDGPAVLPSPLIPCLPPALPALPAHPQHMTRSFPSSDPDILPGCVPHCATAAATAAAEQSRLTAPLRVASSRLLPAAAARHNRPIPTAAAVAGPDGGAAWSPLIIEGSPKLQGLPDDLPTWAAHNGRRPSEVLSLASGTSVSLTSGGGAAEVIDDVADLNFH